MNARTSEWPAVAAMLALTGFFWMLTPTRTEAGASIFPNVVMVMMAALVGFKIAAMLLYPQSKETKAKERQPLGRFFFVMASMIVYVAAVDYIGFYVSSFVFFFGVTLAIQVEERTARSIAVRLAVVTGFLLFLWILFTKVLMAQLPRGILF
ncbi:MAG: tripartite tricarboxylate transporter TctB family protein [Deltaproteobacteria bacterium]|jgi:hypothetical protein|nr:tripartite tricarboxylate transporter TctB family protein [Deltaproteobacteria bacterium]